MKTILVTGAAGALGQATVSLLLEKGYKVIAIVRNERSKESLGTHAELHKEVADLNKEDKITLLIDKFVSQHHVIDACVLLAGGFAAGDIKTTTVEMIRQQIELNFETAYNVARALFGHFAANKNGRIILIGSQPPLMPKKGKGVLAYSLSKSLLFHLAEMLNEEAKGSNIVTAVVVPGIIDTKANRDDMPTADTSKWVTPVQVAQTIEFLISDNAAVLREPVLKVYNNVI